MSSRLLVIIAIALCGHLSLAAQQSSCSLSVNIYVKDADTDKPLASVNAYEDGSGKQATTDKKGFLRLKNLCAGVSFHLTISHIGCRSKRIFIPPLHQDTSLNILMEHTPTELHSLTVQSHQHLHTEASETLRKQTIIDQGQHNLANMLEAFAGVSVLKNGNGIAKPVIHGLFGNRLTILNNGVPQSGQQWGNDHAPEIDPLVANRIRVIKGTSTLEYMGRNLGSIILVEPSKIKKEPHWHGSASYFFETNGLSHGANVEVQKYTPALSWRINGTYKKSGDKSAANYYLTNTGGQEANLALQLEKALGDKWLFSFYASTFNTEIGVLRGSHIGNVTDLEQALERSVPFFTEEHFSYTINAPKQAVNHHLFKLSAAYVMDSSQQLHITIASQLNHRKEFDVRRGNRSTIPALSLSQFSLFSEIKYNKRMKKNWMLKSGIQYNFTDNTNNPETGILPLIPDYVSFSSAAFVTLQKKMNKAFLKTGLRYDHQEQKVITITNTIPRELLRYQRTFHNISSSVGYTHFLSTHHKITANVGYAMRNPEVNELYSFGLHQGVSSIEEGDVNLQTERAFKTTLGYTLHIASRFSLQALMYYQNINDYIYLRPQGETRLTIRGAFPTFKYEQTNAEIVGIDISSRISITQSLYTNIKYSFIQGSDNRNNVPLIYMPSNNILASLVYQIEKPILLGRKKLENLEVKVTNKYTFKQERILPEQDFVLPPNGYYLLGMKISSDLQLKRIRLRTVLEINNLLNVAYRDYLNRQRYFADDMGINASLGVSVVF